MTLTQTLAIFCTKYLIFILIIVAGVWFLFGAPKGRRKEVVIFGASSLLLTFLLSLIAAKLYSDPRPFAVGHFTPLVAHGFDNGFPSDHTLLSVAVACIVWRYNSLLGIVLFNLALIIGFSRVYVGVHHLIDIFGAVIIAIVSALLVSIALDAITNKRKVMSGQDH